MKLIIDIPEELYETYKGRPPMLGDAGIDTIAQSIADGIPLPKEHGINFKKIVVEYPPAESCTYPEYRGKPYFSIKYEDNGKHFIGFGTYNPEVLSRYIQEYFIAPTIIPKSEG